MAKALGLIGNFKGKLGNTVGYSLKDSNNKQTQGVRVYQPVVRNPKTAAQAEQRAKLAPINATYRALKMVIDRGQEGKAYGNKSRLAWLSAVMKDFIGYYALKGETIRRPAIVAITNGSLANPIRLIDSFEVFGFNFEGAPQGGYANFGAFCTALLTKKSALKEGQQVTFVALTGVGGQLQSRVRSFVIDTTSTDEMPSWLSFTAEDCIVSMGISPVQFGAIIISEEGSNGAHLRSGESLVVNMAYLEDHALEENKQAAIESYMSQGANTDWAEESLM